MVLFKLKKSIDVEKVSQISVSVHFQEPVHRPKTLVDPNPSENGREKEVDYV